MTTKTTEARREAFEKWCKRTRPVLSVQRGWQPGTLDKYQSDKTNMAWRAWNAALDSLCVELPDSSEHFSEEARYAYRLGVEDCAEALAAAGVPCK